MFDFVKNREGKKLFVAIDHPKGSGPFPAVVIVHGFSGFSSEVHITGISNALVDKGFLTIRPDLTKNPGRSYLDFSKITYKQEIKDVEDILDWTIKLKEVNKEKIGIAGHSLAGLITGEIASRRKEIKALGILSGVYSYKLLQGRTFRKPLERALKDFKAKGYTSRWHRELKIRLKIGKAYHDDMVGRTADDFAKQLKCPTLIIVSGDDESVSRKHTDSWYKNIGSDDKTRKVIRGAKHVYKDGYLDEVEKVVSNWFYRKLVANLQTQNI